MRSGINSRRAAHIFACLCFSDLDTRGGAINEWGESKLHDALFAKGAPFNNSSIKNLNFSKTLISVSK